MVLGREGMIIRRLFGILSRNGVRLTTEKLVSRVFDVINTRLYAVLFGIEIGRGSVIKPGAKLRTGGGRIRIGNNCVIHSLSLILAHGGSVELGDSVSLNPFSILYGHGGLRIGHRVLIAAGSVIIPANHSFVAGRPIRGQGLTCEGIAIGDDVWIGAGCQVLDGSRIEDGAIIAAGCVVAGQHVQQNWIFGGVPGKMIGIRK